MSKHLEALDLMRTQGWWRGDGDSHGQCMSNALVFVTDGSAYSHEHAVLGRVCQEQFPEIARQGDSLWAIFDVNDHPDTTFADVERLMEKSALVCLEETF